MLSFPAGPEIPISWQEILEWPSESGKIEILPHQPTPATNDLACEMLSIPAGPEAPLPHQDIPWWLGGTGKYPTTRSGPAGETSSSLWPDTLLSHSELLGLPGPLARKTLPHKQPALGSLLAWDYHTGLKLTLHWAILEKPLLSPQMALAELNGIPSIITLKRLWKLSYICFSQNHSTQK